MPIGGIEPIILYTPIVAGQPTELGVVYPRDVLEFGIKVFGGRSLSPKGGLLDESRLLASEMLYDVEDLLLDEEGRLCARVRLHKSKIKRFFDLVEIGVTPRPIMCVPRYVAEAIRSDRSAPYIVTKIYGITTVHLEITHEQEQEVLSVD